MNITKKIKERIRQNELKVNSFVKEIEIIEDTGEVLVDRKPSGRIENWRKYKLQSRKVYRLFRKAKEQDSHVISASALNSLRDCGDILTFKVNLTKQESKLHNTFFCKNKFCPVCARRRSKLLAYQTSKVVDRILAEEPTARFLFLTLTTKNVGSELEIKREVDRYCESIRMIFNNGKGSLFGTAKKFRQQVLGTIRHIEATFNLKRDEKGQGYHVHSHILIAVKGSYFLPENYLTQKEFQEMWKKAARLDYDPIVHVKVIKGYGQNLKKAIIEVSKYPTKPANILDLPESKAVEVLSNLQYGLYNRRLVTFTGLFRKYRRELKLEDIEKSSLIHVGDEETTDEHGDHIEYHVFRWCNSLGEYICAKYQVVQELDFEYFREKRREKNLENEGLAG